MERNRETARQNLRRWEDFIGAYHLPAWEELPDFGLYMDQVVVLLEQYLGFLPAAEGDRESLVTASAVNNYVRLKLMPAPVKRKYYRPHLAYLLMIVTLKQAVSIGDLRRLLPPSTQEDAAAVQALYHDYGALFARCVPLFSSQLHKAAQSLSEGTDDAADGDAVGRLVMESALLAGFFRIMTEKLIRAEEKSEGEA